MTHAGRAEAVGKRLSIGIKVSWLNPNMASVWYRGLYPAVHLRALGHTVEVFDTSIAADRLQRLDVIVLVKPTAVRDLELATAARDLRIPIVLDLCDDVFIPGYGANRGAEASICRAVAGLSAAAVTTGPVLAAKLRDMVAPGVPVVEIADPIENEVDNAAVMSAFGRLFLRARLQRRIVQMRAFLRPRQRLRALVTWLRKTASACSAALRPPRRLLQVVGLARALPRLTAPARSVRIREWPRQARRVLRRGFADPSGPAGAVPSGDAPRAAAQAPAAAPLARGRPTAGAAVPPAPPPLPVLPLMPAAVAPRPGQSRKTVIWFGIKGAAHGDFGIRNLTLVAPALARVAADIPLRLVVVSNGPEEFARVTAGWPFPCEYRAWSRASMLSELDAADVCIVPNSHDVFSIGKSANRHALALSRGVPVVATAIPALQGMEHFMILDDWERGLRTYLTDPAHVTLHVEAGQAHVRAAFSPAALGRNWEDLLQDVVLRSAQGGSGVPPAPRVLFFLDLIQDLDVLLPVLEAMRDDTRFAPEACVTDWLAKASPRVVRELLRHRLTPRIVPRKETIAGTAPTLKDVHAVVTAAETSHPAHRALHAVASRAAAAGIATYTFQHGLENIGLTYFASDPEHPEPIRFASARIFTWGPVEALPPDVQPGTRARCVAVGCPKAVQAAPVPLPLPPHAGPVVGVFENLHWKRYDKSFVKAFLADLGAVATRFEHVLFLVKPHPAARWLAKNEDAQHGLPANVVVADPALPAWEPFTAGAILASVDGIITTPSTVALDAARVGRPVAVAGYGLRLPAYEPLPILLGPEDWAGFVEDLVGGGAAMGVTLEQFRSRHLKPGNALPVILDLVASDIGKQAAAVAAPGLHDPPKRNTRAA